MRLHLGSLAPLGGGSAAWPLVIGISLLLQATLTAATAIYQDQAGLADWQQKHIGVPILTQISRQGENTHIVVATDKNVLAVLDPLTDHLVWRHVLDANDTIQTLAVVGPRVVTLTTRFVRAWDLHTAFMIWEHRIMPSAAPAVTGLAAFPDLQDPAIVVLDADRRVTRYRAVDGTAQWATEAEDADVDYTRVFAAEGNVFLLGNDRAALAPSRVRLATVHLATGLFSSLYDTAPAHTPHELALLAPAADSAWLAWLAPEGLVINRVGHPKLIRTFGTHDLGLSAEGLSGAVITTGDPSATTGFLLTGSRATHAVMVTFDTDGYPVATVSTVRDAIPNQLATVGAGARGEPLVATLDPGADVVVVRVHSLAQGDQQLAITLPYPATTVGPAISLDLVPGTDFFGTAVLVRFASGRLVLADAQTVRWAREEALAHVVDFTWLDLPDAHQWSEDRDELAESPAVTESSGPVTRYLRRCAVHLNQLRNLVSSAGHAILPFLRILAPATSTSTAGPVFGAQDGDAFGIRKLAVFLSAPGTLVALDTLHGSVAWVLYLPALDARLAGTKFTHLFTTRTAAARFPPIFSAVGRGDQNGVYVVRLDGLTGKVFTSDQFPEFLSVLSVPATHVYQLPFEEVIDRFHPLVFLYPDGETPARLRLLPNTPAVRKDIQRRAAHLTFLAGPMVPAALTSHTLDAGSTLGGYRPVVTDLASTVLPTLGLWKLPLATDERIVAVQPVSTNAAVASLGRVLGNRSVLYKYLNPGVVAVATMRSVTEQQTGEPTGILGLYLVDAVSGALLHRAIHHGIDFDPAHHPVHLVGCENWLVYQYWSSAGHGSASSPVAAASGYVTVALDLYTSSTPDTRGPASVFSSWQGLRPHVISQAFMLPEQVTALGVTTTRNGVAVREVIMALASGRIVGLPRVLLDPRRPLADPTEDQKLEGLMRYDPLLPNNPRWTLSHYHQVLGVQSLHSAPAKLESTSLVLAYGLDLFFTRVSPSGTFDRLSESFSKPMLLATLVALIASLFVAGPMVRRKALMEAWA
ncbi:hypothetical protein IWQ60_011271 [Tieghemiomyces parasiticus]|uniref:ER membrane protein complex subunit 1 n=1 Tax=Tieghemiomyces parasiticus TaxID=78921 RepID=A0A9W8DLU8_9FUNG|nr:hypothetical protein IWQ60_011271 [Tieghemiomyces parasiticus]